MRLGVQRPADAKSDHRLKMGGANQNRQVTLQAQTLKLQGGGKR